MIRRLLATALRRVADLLEGPETIETHHPVVVDDEALAELLASSRQMAMAFHPHSPPPLGEAWKL